MIRAPLRTRDRYEHWERFDTRFGDNDAFGHVNNVVYYSWYDTAINSLLLGAGLYTIGGSEEIAYVAESSCRFVRSLTYPGTIEVGLVVERLGTSSLTWQLGAFAEDDPAAAAEGRVVQVCVSRSSGRPIPIPATWRAYIADRGLCPDDSSARPTSWT